MTQTEKDALIRAEKVSYKKNSNKLYDEQQRVAIEFKTKMTEISDTMLKHKAEHNLRMQSIMAIEAERNPDDGVSRDEKRKLHEVRSKLSKHIQEYFGEDAKVYFAADDTGVTFTVKYHVS